LNTGYKANLKIFYDIIEKRLQYSWQASDNIDLKANYLLGFEGIILSVIFSSYSRIIINIHIIYIIGVILIFLSFFLTICTAKCIGFYINPKPKNLIKKYIKSKEIVIYEVVLSSMLKAYEKNNKIISGKAKCFNYSIFTLFVGILFIITSVLLNLEGGCLQIKW